MLLLSVTIRKPLITTWTHLLPVFQQTSPISIATPTRNARRCGRHFSRRQSSYLTVKDETLKSLEAPLRSSSSAQPSPTRRHTLSTSSLFRPLLSVTYLISSSLQRSRRLSSTGERISAPLIYGVELYNVVDVQLVDIKSRQARGEKLDEQLKRLWGAFRSREV